MPWQSRALLPLILRKVDRAGLIELGRHGVAGLAALTGIPADVALPGLEGLIACGAIEQNGTTIVVPNFLEAQEVRQSDAQRAREYRARRRDDARNGGPEPDSSAVVYFIQAGRSGAIKIGTTGMAVPDALKNRIENLQIGCPDKLVLLGTIPGGNDRERELHERFAHLTERGEWFRPEADLLTFIRDAVTPDVTGRHDVTNKVTPSVPSQAIPSQPSERARARVREVGATGTAAPIPADLSLSDASKAYAEQLGVTGVEAEWEAFKAHYQANGQLAVDWQAGFRKWAVNAAKYQRRDRERERDRPTGRRGAPPKQPLGDTSTWSKPIVGQPGDGDASTFDPYAPEPS
jgi:hypothetical protein